MSKTETSLKPKEVLSAQLEILMRMIIDIAKEEALDRETSQEIINLIGGRGVWIFHTTRNTVSNSIIRNDPDYTFVSKLIGTRFQKIINEVLDETLHLPITLRMVKEERTIISRIDELIDEVIEFYTGEEEDVNPN